LEANTALQRNFGSKQIVLSDLAAVVCSLALTWSPSARPLPLPWDLALAAVVWCAYQLRLLVLARVQVLRLVVAVSDGVAVRDPALVAAVVA
jgi:hypothetical protein